MKHCPNENCEHLARYGRIAEFLDSLEVCSDCGSLLRHGEAPPGPVLEYRELVTVYETTNQIQAHLIRAFLEQHHLPVSISGESLQGALGELPPTMPFIRVQVPIDQADRARELIEGHQGSLVPSDDEGSPEDVERTDPVLPQALPPVRVGFRGPPLLGGLALLVLGAIIGFILSESELLESDSNALLYPDELDQNLDGRSDVWFVYRGGLLAQSKSDRNFDGRPDYWQFFRDGDGLIVRSENDDSFDGAVDVWNRYRAGNVVESKADTDHNGVPDITVEYTNGVPHRLRLHPNLGPVEREQRFVDGMLREEYSVTPDGTLKLIRSYDEVGREIDSRR